jgi:hypothetical protein
MTMWVSLRSDGHAARGLPAHPLPEPEDKGGSVVIRTIQKMLAPIRRKLAQIASRAVILLSDDGHGLQETQIRALADEVMDRIERSRITAEAPCLIPGPKA